MAKNGIFIAGMVIVFVVILLLVSDRGHEVHLIRQCHANQRVLAMVLEDYYAAYFNEASPISLVNGSIDEQLLLHRNVLKSKIQCFSECRYCAFPTSSTTVEVFCLSCGFCEQSEPTIRQEFFKRFKSVASVAAHIEIDFTAVKDCSQQDKAEFNARVSPPWYKRLLGI